MFGDFLQEFGALYIISQVFALVSLVFDLAAVQQRKKSSLLKMDTAAAFCSFLHYLFLGAWAGVISKIITTVRNALAARDAAKKYRSPKILPLIFVGLYIIMGILTFDSAFSVLPILAPSIYTIIIYTGDVKMVRLGVVISNAIWMIYNACVFSIMGVIASAILVVNGLVAIYRYRKTG